MNRASGALQHLMGELPLSRDPSPPTGLGVSRDTIQRWCQRGLIPSLSGAELDLASEPVRTASQQPPGSIAFTPIAETVLVSVCVDSLIDD
jgi:hypothetical protein